MAKLIYGELTSLPRLPVSMLDGKLFDKFEQLGRALRGNSRPFGGIQLIVTGDLYQLPPGEHGDSRECGHS